MDIFDLKKAVTEMADDELIDTLQDIRRNRRNVARAPTKQSRKKALEPVQLDYEDMNVNALEQLLMALGGTDEPQV